MTTVQPTLVLFVLTSFFGPSGSNSAAQDKPIVAFSHKGDLCLLTQSGQLVRTLPTTPPIGTFAMSPDGRSVVFAPLPPNGYGGPLYLLTISTGKVERLTFGTYFGGSPEQGKPEVYGEPDFSPDGQQVVFAIHGQETGDIVEASGPVAILDMRGRRVHIVESTLTANGAGGVAFANSPRWSPDGKHILVNFEMGAAILDVADGMMKNLDTVVPEAEGGLSYSLGWLGSGCVLYTPRNTTEKHRQISERVLNIRTGKIQSADLLIPSPMQSRLVAFSPSLVVRADPAGHLLVESTGSRIKPWTIRGDERTTYVRIVGSRADGALVPEACR